MTEGRRIEGTRNRLIAEWDKETGRLKSVDFIPPEDDGTETAPEDRPDRPVEQAEPIIWPPIESPGDLLRRLGGSGIQGHVWGD